MVVDRINRALMKLIARRSGARPSQIVVDANGIGALAGSEMLWRLAWSEVQRVTAFRSAGFVGDALVLAFQGMGETRLVTEDQAGWQELTAALPQHLHGAESYETWALQAIRGTEGQPHTVFERR